MRDPEVERFLAHTRLAGEGDAKADFERRVDVMREKLLANVGDEMKYSEDQPRDNHGRFGSDHFDLSPKERREHLAAAHDVHLGAGYTPSQLEELHAQAHGKVVAPKVGMTQAEAEQFMRGARQRWIDEEVTPRQGFKPR